ncbi:MAG: Zinc/iron permease [Candidatus Woesebacteria bacterium GW2011_GWB1_43_14]|uniref:Zinc/iron permease n=1 Tax=Candidatus Woesebacteria bacterium GW2011_GWB1_43_14 TaxID=1618578 RepID=A0A0G1DGZ4_9BACT|nr:MAG: divalent heavy-metal cations transporter [Candidatus Woesebacteria bacterium GW2011_GWC1_42_9]KKS96969.1 MAG: Zinc/iron permease [Candidatus Woesebacteria bacterium GW2011_GWB1_43_14]
MLVEILLLTALGSIAGLIGGVFFLVKNSWARALSHNAVPFAAGVLLSVSIINLIPEASELAGDIAFTVVLVSFIASFLFEQFFCHLHHHEGRRNDLESAIPLVIVGDTIHNVIDGIAIASSYLIEPKFGLVVALATFLHETPHEIGDFGILIKAGYTKQRTFLINLFSALATFPGALLVYFYFKDTPDKIGIFLAISAGIFLYLGASDFLPQVEEDSRIPGIRKYFLVILGALVMYLQILIKS